MPPPSLKLAKSLWGVPEADDPAQWDALFSRIKEEGFDGVEAITLTWRKDKDLFTSLLQKHGLALICQIHTTGGDVDAKTGAYQYCRSNKLHDHLASFVKLTTEAKALGAVMINSHSGHDSWGSGDKALSFFKYALKVEKALDIPVVHETHRQRLLCSPYPTAELLSKPELADLKINADLSHWCCVCEKLFDAADARDDWWPATLTLVARHCELVHARVGHAQGPQVSQPEAPEFAAEVKAHSSWWRAIWAAQAERHTGHGATVWVTPEHGPPPYQQTLPYSQEPVAELWEVNRQMAARVRREHAAALADVTAAAAPTHLPLPPPLDFFAGDACLDGSPFAGVKAGFIFRKGDRGLGYYRDEFVPAPAFDGPKPGFVFRSGGRGTGYYRDGLVEARPAGGAAPKVGRDGSLIQAAMIEDPDVAARLGPMMGGATPAPPVGAPKGGLLSTGMESVRIEAEAAGEEEAERERRIVQATGEGVKVGAEMAAAHAEGGVEFVCTSVDAPMGEIQFILVALAAMNRAAGDDDTPGGGSAHVAKMVFSAGQDQLALVAYVPEQTTLQVDAASWAQAVLTEIGGKVMCSKPQPAQSPAGGQVVCAAVRADAEEEHVPAKDLQIGMAASARFLGAAEANA